MRLGGRGRGPRLASKAWGLAGPARSGGPARVEPAALTRASASERNTAPAARGVRALPGASATPLALDGLAAPVPATLVEIGVGPPIVFLHGLVGLNEHWEGVVALMHARARCLLLQIPLLDLRGEDCSIGGVTRLTTQYLRDHLREPAVLVGNSFGGHVALRVALEQPELVKGLVLAGSSGLIERSMVREVQIKPSKHWLREKIGELFYDPSHMREADLERAHKELSDRHGARAMVRLSRTARRNHLGEKIRNIHAPTLLIWGREDVVTPPSAAEAFMHLLPNARIEWFERCGHVPMLEATEGFAEALGSFVDELAGVGVEGRGR